MRANYEEVLGLTTPAGVDPEIVKQAWAGMSKRPDFAEQDSRSVASAIIRKVKGATAPAQLPQVTVTGQRSNMQDPGQAMAGVPRMPQMERELPGAYRDTPMAARNAANPQAELLKQYDPEMLRRAYAQYQQQYNQDASKRNVQNFLGANAPNLVQNQAMWDKDQERKKEFTVGQQLALAKMAGEGIDAAGKIQTQDQTRLQFPGVQAGKEMELAKSRNDLIGSGFTAQMQQRMNDPDSIESRSAKAMLLRQLQTLPGGAPREIVDLVRSSNGSAAELLPIMGQFAPAAADSFLKMLGGQQTQAQTALTGEQTRKEQIGNRIAGAVAESTTISPEVQRERDLTRLRILKEERDQRTAPNTPDRLAIEREIASTEKRLAGAYKERINPNAMGETQTSFSGGGITVTPNPAATIKSQAAGQSAVDDAKRFENYNNYVKPAATQLLKEVQDIKSGKLTAAQAAIFGGDKAKLVSMLNQMNGLMASVLPPAISQELQKINSTPGYSGRLIASLSTSDVENIVRDFVSKMEAEKRYKLEKTDAVAAGAQPTDVWKDRARQEERAATEQRVPMTDGKRAKMIPLSKVKEAEQDGWKRI
jgi:hypothetical protein